MQMNIGYTHTLPIWEKQLSVENKWTKRQLEGHINDLSDWLWNAVFTAQSDKPDCRLHANEMSWWYVDRVWCRITAAQSLTPAIMYQQAWNTVMRNSVV